MTFVTLCFTYVQNTVSDTHNLRFHTDNEYTDLILEITWNLYKTWLHFNVQWLVMPEEQISKAGVHQSVNFGQSYWDVQ